MKIEYLPVEALLAIVVAIAAVRNLSAQIQAPAYVIAEIDVTDSEAFKEYAPRVQPSFAPFGGRYVVRGGKAESLAGEPPKRGVVLAFDTMERAQSRYASPEYEALKALRDKAGKARIFVVEGLAR
jgi:uncharacterized protein (DUF1330 family)